MLKLVRICHESTIKLPFVKAGPLNILTHYHRRKYYSFNLWPSLHRTEDYKKLNAGYNFATFNLSYGVGAGGCETFLNYIYALKGYHSSQSSV